MLGFQRRTAELVAGEVREIGEGSVALTPSLPDVWMLNYVRIDGEVSYEEAVALCRHHLGASHFDQLFVDHEPTGRALAETFRAHGWEVDVDVHSVLARDPDRRAPTEAVIEPEEQEALALMERWVREDKTLHLSEDGVRQLVQTNRLTWRALGARRLGIRGPDGSLAATTLLFSDGRLAQVESVYTVPEARGRGYARALVTKAVELAAAGGHELTFIVADDNDWPKQLYGKLGFDPVGRSWLFHRELNAG